MNDLSSADANIQTVLLEAISEGIPGGVLVYDKNDLILFASQQLLGLLSVPKSFLTPGTRLRDFLGAAYDSGGRFAIDSSSPRRMLSRDDWIAEQIASLWKERVATHERRSTDRWLSVTKRRLSSGYGIAIVRDVSEHKKREEQWHADAERVQVTEEVLDNLPFPITVKDSKLTFVAVNKMAARFLDLPSGAILGRKASDIYPPEVESHLDIVNRRVLELGEPQQLAELVTRPDGSQTVVIATKYRIGKPGRYYLVTATEDITGLVGTGEDGEEIVPHISRGDLIPVSFVRPEPDAPAPAAGRTDVVSVAGCKVLFASSDHRIRAEALTILDGLRLDSSSVSGVEELELFLRFAKEAGVLIDLVVIDTLMDRRCLETARRHGIATFAIEGGQVGRDLGAAVRRLLSNPVTTEKTDGEIGEKDWEIATNTPAGLEIDVLVAEDNEVNQIVFSHILQGLGYSYKIAADGEEAIRLWSECEPRLILMDITLPKLSGYEASAKIRSLETIDNSIPIIGVLAQAFDRDRDACFAAGMNDVILKPISPEAIETVFRNFLSPAENGRMLSLSGDPLIPTGLHA